MIETQSCYVCGKYFEDKVKLGLHLTPCYNEAVSVRKELWHPHPLDLVDEQRYTEYMKGRFQQREQHIKDANKDGISFVTADTFEAMRGTLGPVRNRPPTRDRPQTRDRVAQVVPPSPPSRGPAHQQPPPVSAGHQEQVAQPVRVVATGVTMLRNELHSEIEQLRRLRQDEENNAAARNNQFNELMANFNAVRGGELRVQPVTPYNAQPEQLQQRQKHELLYSSPQTAPYQSPQYVPQPQYTSLPAERAPPSAPVGLPAVGRPATSQADPCEVLSDGRLRCGTCGKSFGKKGFEVHAQRCFRGTEDFTFSRDARFERNHPSANQPVPALQAERYAPQSTTGGGGGGGGGGDWTQFMTTYPRPVIDEAPKTAKERNQAADAAKQKAEMAKMIAREMSGAPAPVEEREATVPCEKCGRYFYASRVAKHEATCVAKKKR